MLRLPLLMFILTSVSFSKEASLMAILLGQESEVSELKTRLPELSGLKYQAVSREDPAFQSYWRAAAVLNSSFELPALVLSLGDKQPVMALHSGFQTQLKEAVEYFRKDPAKFERAQQEVAAALKVQTMNARGEAHPIFIEGEVEVFGSMFEGRLEVAIDPGFHTNSHQPHQDWLIPTRLEGQKGTFVESSEFPRGHDYDLSFSDQPVSLYEGTIEVIFRGKVDSTTPGVVYHFQACDDQRCLRPASIGLEFQ